MTSSRRLVKKLHEFIKMQGRVEKVPGFSSALQLDHKTLFGGANNAVTSADKNGVTLRYSITPSLLLPVSETVSLSTLMAAIDEITTWALVLGDEQRARPGKSVSLNLWRAPASTQDSLSAGNEVDIVTSVRKIGRNLGFCDAQVRDVASGNLLCFGSHIKYLPMGPLFDAALSSYGWKAATLYSDYMLSDPPSNQQQALTDLFESLEFNTDTSAATFQVESTHASLGGPIHGGCQAVLMELVATRVAQQQQSCDYVNLDSIHVEYMSPPNSRSVEVQAQVMSDFESDDASCGSVLLKAKLACNGKTRSEGVLRFTRMHD